MFDLEKARESQRTQATGFPGKGFARLVSADLWIPGASPKIASPASIQAAEGYQSKLLRTVPDAARCMIQTAGNTKRDGNPAIPHRKIRRMTGKPPEAFGRRLARGEEVRKETEAQAKPQLNKNIRRESCRTPSIAIGTALRQPTAG